MSAMKISPHLPAVLENDRLRANLRGTLRGVVRARQKAVEEVPNWEQLRHYARQVKLHTLARLDHYLLQLEGNIRERGGEVIWAETPQEAIEFILDLAHRREIRKLVKSKTMLGEEMGLNEALEWAGLEPVETDLGEYIVQVAGERPFHLIAPALHKSRGEIAQLFAEKLGMAPSDDVQAITRTARDLLRKEFLSARLGITGVNFAVAETGALVVVENEGNARLSLSVPEVHVALMGIEKVVPRTRDLAVFLKLLVRSATGQRMTSYVNLVTGGRQEGELDGPQSFYLILLDNGRSEILADPHLRQTLACIRCGACLNVCPVYQTIGGHAYDSVYQGPIGAILTPQLKGGERAPEHPFASSLCGACQEVCPVKIEIPHILLRLRERVQARRRDRPSSLSLERMAVCLWAWALSSPSRFTFLTNLLRAVQKRSRWWRRLGQALPFLRQWSRERELPALAEQSFRDWMAEEGKS